MIKKESRNSARLMRHARIRSKISGTGEVPRLSVFRSNKQIYAQIIDDEKKSTLVSASSLDKSLKLENFSDIKEGDIIEITTGTRVLKAKVISVLEHATKENAGDMYELLS